MNNEERIFSLLEKVYIELQETKKELKAEVQKNREGIERLEIEVQKNREGIEKLQSGMDELKMEVNSLTAKTAHNENKIIELSRDLKRVK
ncbi:hypothetical protein [Proteiniborus sp. MB09-C3]|uniref:hypothetical protein n=1 Tax=Proteiniborus sp. MB09-C3 TaxID=3050072 RepID=UPI002556912A|nr:hypothetical protein [Proteiniborus sp. MB09-C3]WIV12248.1 hypothetical protein QO263_00565 [Proteiniborus sp. MB09-C3]